MKNLNIQTIIKTVLVLTMIAATTYCIFTFGIPQY